MINPICRLCLKEENSLKSLYEENGVQILESLTSIKIKYDTNTNNSACTQCWENLKSAYNIQQHFLKCNKIFLLIGTNLIKENNSTVNLDLEENKMEVDRDVNQIEKEKNKSAETEDVRSEITETIKIEKKDFSCEICGDKMPIIDSIEHIKQHFKGPQNCEDCEKTFLNLDHYRIHISKEHKNYPKIWSCDDCKLVFNYKSLFNIHRVKVHKFVKNIKPSSVYTLTELEMCELLSKPPTDPGLIVSLTSKSSDKLTCPECSKVFTHPNLYEMHLKNHKRTKCDICSKTVTTVNFHKHRATHVASSVICDVCGTTCKNAESLRTHIHFYHKNKIFPCEYCEKTFNRAVVRDVHTKKRHTGEKNFICDTCAKGFFTRAELKCHIKMVHLKLRPHVCKFCEKGFSSKYAMITHMRQHTNELPFKCDVCGEGFRQRVSLNSHLKSKHDIEKEKTLECDVCSKMFATKSAVFCHKQRMH